MNKPLKIYIPARGTLHTEIKTHDGTDLLTELGKFGIWVKSINIKIDAGDITLPQLEMCVTCDEISIEYEAQDIIVKVVNKIADVNKYFSRTRVM